MTDEEAAQIAERQKAILDHFDSVELKTAILYANEKAKYTANALDRFSTSAFTFSVIAASFAMATIAKGWTSEVLNLYRGVCIVWFVSAFGFHWLGRIALKRGLRA